MSINDSHWVHVMGFGMLAGKIAAAIAIIMQQNSTRGKTGSAFKIALVHVRVACKCFTLYMIFQAGIAFGFPFKSSTMFLNCAYRC